MKLNKKKRIGEIIIIIEGDHPELEIIETIFHKILGYTIKVQTRHQEIVRELHGYDKNSIIKVISSPTSNLIDVVNINDFYDKMYSEIAVKLDLDLINNPVYILFDRDPGNNRQSKVLKLLEKLKQSQTTSDEQNGLLLLSYPSIESYIISMFESNSYHNEQRLGKDAKNLLDSKNYNINDAAESHLINSAKEFLNFLKANSLINENEDIFTNIESIGIELFHFQTKKYSKTRLFNCVSQFVEILIDLRILDIEGN